jgi:hypothetical protein
MIDGSRSIRPRGRIIGAESSVEFVGGALPVSQLGITANHARPLYVGTHGHCPHVARSLRHDPNVNAAPTTA